MKFLTIKEIAEFCGVHYRTAHEWIKKGLIQATKFGSQWMIAEDDFLDWYRENYE